MFRILSYLATAILYTVQYISRNKLPLYTCVNAIILNKEGKFLVQKRADGRGYGLPGGMTKAYESVEDGVRREVFEECGIKVKDLRFLFVENPSRKYPYAATLIYEAKTNQKKLKGSWEGKVMWMEFKSLKGKMAFNFEEVLERYLRDYKL